MKLSHRLRKVWHDVFYKTAPQAGREFALKCQDVTFEIDLKSSSKSLSRRFRVWFHLGICQACRNYDQLSQVLSKAAREQRGVYSIDIEKMNHKLVEKYAQKKNESKH